MRIFEKKMRLEKKREGKIGKKLIRMAPCHIYCLFTLAAAAGAIVYFAAAGFASQHQQQQYHFNAGVLLIS